MPGYLKKKRWTRADGAGILDDIERSGVSDSAFALHQDLDPQRISKWRGRLGRPRKSMPRCSPTFVEVNSNVAAPARSAEIRLRNGRSVIVSVDGGADALGALLDVVEGGGC